MLKETEFTSAAITAVLPHLDKLPEDVRRKVYVSAALLRNHGCVNLDILREELGAQPGRPWVIARRTPRIVERYGADVVCVTPKRFDEAERRAALRMGEELAEEYDATEYPEDDAGRYFGPNGVVSLDWNVRERGGVPAPGADVPGNAGSTAGGP